MKVLLTGASGFIGQACLFVLRQTDWEIHALSRTHQAHDKRIHWHHCDVLDEKNVSTTFAKISPDFLLHLAWIVDHPIFWVTEKNIPYIFATIHLYKEFSINGGKKAVFLGTCAEYEKTISECDEEKTALKPNTLYGVCKKQTFELLTQLKLNEPKYADFSWVRLFHIYGPNENPNRFIPFIFCSYLAGKIPSIHHPTAIRDYIYSEDAAQILIHLLQYESSSFTQADQQRQSRAINIGSGQRFTNIELAKRIHENFFNKNPAPLITSQANLTEDCLVPHLNRLKQFNLDPPISFDKRMEKTYEWWKRNSNSNL